VGIFLLSGKRKRQAIQRGWWRFKTTKAGPSTEKKSRRKARLDAGILEHHDHAKHRPAGEGALPDGEPGGVEEGGPTVFAQKILAVFSRQQDPEGNGQWV
jgi:hypothetical protein